ncbi:MAG: Serine-protein kinase RsbW, partial [uncultured Frankineae bacterium]
GRVGGHDPGGRRGPVRVRARHRRAPAAGGGGLPVRAPHGDGQPGLAARLHHRRHRGPPHRGRRGLRDAAHPGAARRRPRVQLRAHGRRDPDRRQRADPRRSRAVPRHLRLDRAHRPGRRGRQLGRRRRPRDAVAPQAQGQRRHGARHRSRTV